MFQEEEPLDKNMRIGSKNNSNPVLYNQIRLFWLIQIVLVIARLYVAYYYGITDVFQLIHLGIVAILFMQVKIVRNTLVIIWCLIYLALAILASILALISIYHFDLLSGFDGFIRNWNMAVIIIQPILLLWGATIHFKYYQWLKDKS